MKVIKITAVWCSGCLIMNKIWNNILQKNDILTINLDYDMDYEEVLKYDVGNILPVFIFFKDEKEIKRVVGEIKEQELLKIVEELENE